ncbi:MAG: hypothetical protein EBU98_00140 [Actinobacteria bacterium]|nr:hypothetical protein [Actinomycetota bacterium]
MQTRAPKVTSALEVSRTHHHEVAQHSHDPRLTSLSFRQPAFRNDVPTSESHDCKFLPRYLSATTLQNDL